jgi:hypothetical protein
MGMPPCRCVRFGKACHLSRWVGFKTRTLLLVVTYLEPANFTVRHLGAHPLRVSIYMHSSVRIWNSPRRVA